MPLQPHRSVLIVEDEPVIALDLEAALDEAGYHVAHTTSTCGGALEWLASYSPDLAVLDITLSDGDCIRAAELLVERSIPFIVFSVRDLGEEDEFDPVLLKGQWVVKPCPTANVIAALDSMRAGEPVS